jgi:excisionase family DNA binding protein
MPALLTVREVAETFRVEPATVYRLASNGTLRSVRLGGSVRIYADAVDEIFAASQEAA